jgi:hypothetical protein
VIIHTVADTAPVWIFRLKQLGEAFDLTAPGAAVSARVRMSDATLVSKPAVIEDADDGVVSVTWAAADLDVEGPAKLDLLYSASGGVAQHPRRPIDVFIRAEYADPEEP